MRVLVLGLCLVLLGSVTTYGAPSAAGTPSPTTTCQADKAIWGGFPDLPRVRARLQGEGTLTVVALGSSSTQGVGASDSNHAYPAQLQRELSASYPGRRITVLNRGIGGETVADNLARMDRDALVPRPDLVIWQVGTNDALTGVAATTLRSQLLDGIARVRDVGADLVLMDPQPLPQAQREAAVEAVQAVLASTARAAKVPLLPRHELMSYWLASGQLGAATLLGADGLHMTDASYRCLAERVADLLPAPAVATVSANAT